MTNIGTIGQKYKNRKTGDVGILRSRFDDKSALEFVNELGEPFVISYSAFKNNWRKFTDTNSIDVVDTDIENNDEELITISSFDEIKKTLNKSGITVNEEKNTITVIKENITVAKIVKKGKAFHLAVMPDIYTYSKQRKKIIKEGTTHFELKMDGNDFLTVSFDTIATSIEDVFVIFMNSIINLNLYGYIIED